MAEYCDRHPSARATYYAVKDMSLLTFEGHCAAKHAVALVDQGWQLVPITDTPVLTPPTPALARS